MIFQTSEKAGYKWEFANDGELLKIIFVVTVADVMWTDV